MFRSARIKLTSWYLLIIMLISVSFSFAIYNVLTSELNRVERLQRLRIERGLPARPGANPPFSEPGEGSGHFTLDPDLVAETKNRLTGVLVLINLTILGSSAALGYVLAGRTLRPISEMIDEQNRFITDASHELRTPLTSLKSEIEVNLRDKNLTLTEAKNLLSSNLEDVNSLQVLTDGLIKIAQYQKTENGLEISNISLSSLADDSIKKVASLAKVKKISIKNNINDLTFEGSKPALTELLVVFLDNAIKYSPEGTEVDLSSQKNDGHFLILISDKGVGISEKDLPHLFDRFFRSDKSRSKNDQPGYGLGLSIAKQIVDKHFGSISVQSKVDHGTTFTISLPFRHSHNLI